MALREAKLRVEVDFAGPVPTLSVRVPSRWGERVALGLRRLREGLATLPFEELCPGLNGLQWPVPQGPGEN
jgi:hypothetical protein